MTLRKPQRALLVTRVVQIATADRDMTASRLAERLGVSPSAVKRILRSVGMDRQFIKGSGCYYENGLA